MIALGLTALFVLQDPGGTPPKPPEPPAAQEVAWEEWDDRTARDAVREFGQRMKARTLTLKERMDAVELLARGRNAKLVDPLAKVVLGEKAVTVRKAAADALAHQPEREAKRALVRLLASRELDEVPQVQAVLVTALARAGYEAGADWRVLDGMFERDYAPERIPLQVAILALVKEHRELDALETLVTNLGEPVPADPHDASNPPAECWEKRWKAWQTWRSDVKATLLELTGQRFSTEQEARTWLQKNEKELRRRK